AGLPRRLLYSGATAPARRAAGEVRVPHLGRGAIHRAHAQPGAMNRAPTRSAPRQRTRTWREGKYGEPRAVGRDREAGAAGGAAGTDRAAVRGGGRARGRRGDGGGGAGRGGPAR